MNKKLLLYIQIAAFAISSCSLVFASLTNDSTKAGRVGSVFVGMVFWLGLIAGIACMLVLNKQRKQAGFNEGKIGFIQFFSNKTAFIFDVIMLISFIATILIIAFKSELFIGYVIIALFVFSLEMHCVFNGKNYKYLNIQQKNQEEKING